MKKLFFLALLPLLLKAGSGVIIRGNEYTGWGAITTAGVLAPAHLFYSDETWQCALGEPEFVLLNIPRDLVCLQSRNYPPSTVVFAPPPTRFSAGKILSIDTGTVILEGLDTRPGDSGKLIRDDSGTPFAMIIARKVSNGKTETLAARLDLPITGECVSIQEFRRWCRICAQLHKILQELKKTDGRNAGKLLASLPQNAFFASPQLTEKYRELLNRVLRAGAYISGSQ